ncbi:zinc ribbon domain-containing protein [Rhizobium calliandrae]|uniref:Zinc ribbon domain-containing protein n=1 Tax=Rhizobium calliandrae TaxID=1312182 RepID=A0ABT7KR78_9HYPH|nr:zinc ribbon domain-containing protein [Rhizobium calliandrae]MDL2410657.1 zinc ribbon domain-containing protein [Rhizobium calliandrae]
MFWRAQAAVEERRQQSGGRRGDKGAHLLRGLARCSACGGPMHIIDKGKPPKGGIYLVCSANRRNAGCGNAQAWRVDKLEEALLLCLTSFKTKSFESLNGNVVDQDQKVDAIRAELDDLNRRNKVLIRLAESEDQQAEARFLENAQEIKIKKRELKAAEAELGTRRSDPGNAARLVEILRLSTDLFKIEGEARLESRIRLSSLIRRIVDRVECDPVRGAYMILQIDMKVWHVTSPTEGAFAYQIEVAPWGVDVPPRLLFLLAKNPADSARDAFYDGKGGLLMTAEGTKSFPSPRHLSTRTNG